MREGDSNELDSHSMTSGATPSPSVPHTAPSSSSFIMPSTHPHNELPRRIFIGSMPEKIISNAEQRAMHNNSGFLSGLHQGRHGASEDKLSQIMKEHAYKFFILEGGKHDDWGEEEEQSATNEMLKRWKESEWGQFLKLRHGKTKNDTQPTGPWVGSTFEVGNILGVDIMHIGSSSVDAKPLESAARTNLSTPTVGTSQRNALSTIGETFVTAPSEFTHQSEHETNESVEAFDAAVDDVANSPTSRTGLLETGTDLTVGANAPQSNLSQLLSNDSVPSLRNVDKIDVKGKGKAKQVRYVDSPPARPSEVLERTPSILDPTSSAAATYPHLEPNLEWGDVVLKDRMLVRVAYSRSEELSPKFDDAMNRTTRDLHYEDWAEFLVAWRKDSIEIYQDFSLPIKEWATGHKHLAYVIPTKSSRTHLSLYSWADLTFCITCPPTTTRLNTAKTRWIFSHEKEGTNIFIFKLKSRSRAYDWTWLLWRSMGGHIPRTIDIRNPTLDSKVTIDIPDLNILPAEEASKLTKRENILALCTETLRLHPAWKTLDGQTLQLAWRFGTNLDWVWLDEDICGKPRPWSVLCGLVFKQSAKPPTLEVRKAHHFPGHLHLKDGRRIDQPPSIEGYLDRIRPATQSKYSVYLVTHDGNLFTLQANDATPPLPPGLLLSLGKIDNYIDNFRLSEVGRGSMQVLNATGMWDLRSIVAVRRAFQMTVLQTHDHSEASPETEWSSPEVEESTVDDEADAGGEDALSTPEKKAHLRMRRSFELLFSNGKIIRYEAHSCRFAIQWIQRLRAQIHYWKQRHRLDAKEEIELAQAQRPRLTPQTRLHNDCHEAPPQPPPDLSAPYPALNHLYNWCVIDGCKSIIKGGKVHMRRGFRGPYQLVQLFLVDGHLMQFRILPQSSFHPVNHRKTSLIDAYVCSGYYAALTLPEGEYSPNAEPAPRRYQDGLEADDPDEDMLFMIWYHPHNLEMGEPDAHSGVRKFIPPKTLPRLSAKRKVQFFRTRSKLERDAWCWALNCQIEKISREQKDRESKLRDMGSLVKLE